jgi:hypothetical protein
MTLVDARLLKPLRVGAGDMPTRQGGRQFLFFRRLEAFKFLKVYPAFLHCQNVFTIFSST